MQPHHSRVKAELHRPQRGAFARTGLRGVGVLTQRLEPFAGLLDNSLPPGSDLRAQAESQAARYIESAGIDESIRDLSPLIRLGKQAISNEDSLTATIEGGTLSLKLWKATNILKGLALIMPVSFAYDETLKEPLRGLVQRFMGQVFSLWPKCSQTGIYEYAKEAALETLQDMNKPGKDDDYYPYKYDTKEQYVKMVTMFAGEDDDVVYNVKKPDVPLTAEELLRYTPGKNERELYDMMLRGLEVSASVGDPFACCESIIDSEGFEQRSGECDQAGYICDKVFIAPTPGGVNEIIGELDNMACCYMYEESLMVEQDETQECERALKEYFDWAGDFSCLVTKLYYGFEL